MKPIKQHNLGDCNVGVTDFHQYTVKMASDGMIYIPSFMKIGLGIQVILRLLPIQSERLQCWYC
jgi:hypothetical protein